MNVQIFYNQLILWVIFQHLTFAGNSFVKVSFLSLFHIIVKLSAFWCCSVGQKNHSEDIILDFVKFKIKFSAYNFL